MKMKRFHYPQGLLSKKKLLKKKTSQEFFVAYIKSTEKFEYFEKKFDLIAQVFWKLLLRKNIIT